MTTTNSITTIRELHIGNISLLIKLDA